MADDSESYLSVLEDNHWLMIKSVDPEVFLDYMRQHRVLSEDDCQIVQNHFVNLSRRARMRCFLDIIRTKGPENIKLYFQQLGWEYPHVYREIFRQEPTVRPQSYMQDAKSRLSCDLNDLLTVGLNMKRLCNQKEDLTDQIKEMEAMLKHQKNEIEDLERENQRLRRYEKDNQQIKEKLRTLNTNNEEIKEENRQFLHEIRTLTLEVQRQRDLEATLQANLDEMTQQIQEKSFELSRKSREECDLRAKYEHVRKESLRFQSPSQTRNRLKDIVAQIALTQHEAKQMNMQQQLEILTDDMKNLEETNRDLCEKLEFMQSLLDMEKEERDQMHKRVCVLEHDKNTLESRQMTSVQKIERYYCKIKELEEQKRKLEEERMHVQTKVWEMSQINEKQFEHQHKLENRYDHLQQSFEQFRQDHRYCVPGEPFNRPPRHRLPGMKDRPGVTYRSPAVSTALGKDDPFKSFTSFHAPALQHDDMSSLMDEADGDSSTTCVINPVCESRSIERSGSLTVNLPASMKKKNCCEEDLSVEIEDDQASCLSELSSVSSSTFDMVDINEICSEQSPRAVIPQQTVSDMPVTGKFFIRSNMKEDGEGDNMAVQEGDILYVVQTGEEQWQVMQVDKTNGKLFTNLQGNIPNPDSTSGKAVRRNQSCNSSSRTLERKYAIRREGLRQHSLVNSFTNVYPMKATRLLPVLLLCPISAMKSMLSYMETTAKDWANIIPDGQFLSSAELFTESSRHTVIPWEVRPKDPHKYNNNLLKFIIISITLQSQDALPTFKHLLGDPDLTMDFDQEMKYMKEWQDMLSRAGLHSETVKVVAGQDDRDAFWAEVKEKVSLVQQRVFWLETPPTCP